MDLKHKNQERTTKKALFFISYIFLSTKYIFSFKQARSYWTSQQHTQRVSKWVYHTVHIDCMDLLLCRSSCSCSSCRISLIAKMQIKIRGYIFQCKTDSAILNATWPWGACRLCTYIHMSIKSCRIAPHINLLLVSLCLSVHLCLRKIKINKYRRRPKKITIYNCIECH